MTSFLSKQDSEEVDFAETVDYEVISDTAGVLKASEYLASQSILAVDTENSTIDPHSGWPILLQVGTSEKCYVFEGWRKDIDFSSLKLILEDELILKILFNAKYDFKWIKVYYDIEMANMYCLQAAERLLTVGLPGARKRPSLVDVVEKYLGIKLRKEARSGFINRNPETDPITEKELAYSAADVVLLPELLFQQAPLLTKHELETVAALEFNVIPAIADAELAGTNLNRDGWNANLVKAREKHIAVAKDIFQAFDEVISQKNLFGLPTFNLGSPIQLKSNLKKLGFELKDTNEATLRRYKDKHEVFALLLRYRGLDKVITAYGKDFLKKINPKTGRLHCQFNQLEADTGRMSSSKPNLQQVPGFKKKDPDSLDFRSCFTARPGYKLVTADFSQQELRILADMSGDPTFRKAYTTKDEDGNELDVHKYTASVIFGTPYAEVDDVQRGKAKVLNFFLVYGGGAYSLAQTLKITEDEAQGIIDDYFKRYSKIKTFLDTCANEALTKGYSLTISGRKRFLTVPSPNDPDFKRIRSSVRRRGKNTPIQGGGADVTKQAMVFLYRALKAGGYDARILMIVHDEFVVEVRDDQADEVAKIVEREMVRGFSHFFKQIPMRVDAHVGPTWEK